MVDLTEVEKLKIGLMTHGMVVTSSAREAMAGDTNAPLTLADYASTSGISMELEQGIWVNAPFKDHNPNFVNDNVDYELSFTNGLFFVTFEDREIKARPIPVPAYHTGKASNGEPYRNLAITHTDRVRISPIEGCAIVCKFCDLPYEFRYRTKDVNDLVESVKVALEDQIQPARHVLISGGTPRPEDYDYQNEVYRAVASAFPGVDVDVMMVPMPGLLDAQKLKEVGINGLSINLELYNEERARKIMPGKYKASRKLYFDFIEQAVPFFGEGKVRSLLMVGIESLEDTLKGVEALAQRGCDPVLSPFRPDPSTPMRTELPPSEDFLKEVYFRSREIVERYPGVKLGPRCIPCQHNTLTFPDNSGKYFSY